MNGRLVLPAAAMLGLCLGVDSMTIAKSQLHAQEKPAALLRHVVLFKFKPDVTKAQIQEVVDAFAALPKKIDFFLSQKIFLKVTPLG